MDAIQINIFLLFINLFFSAFGQEPSSEQPILLEISFHIASDLEMVKDGLRMKSWISEKDIREVVLPEVNRIWQFANIQFQIEQITIDKTTNPPNKSGLIAGIVSAERDENGKSDSKRIKKLNKLFNYDPVKPSLIHIFLVPYLGEASQGNASPDLIVFMWDYGQIKNEWPSTCKSIAHRNNAV
ncbi:MAG: hypothetical protein H6629_00055 [Calditrichae bacterium]|nr:hypothetical protein [Calditrichia bacterium]